MTALTYTHPAVLVLGMMLAALVFGVLLLAATNSEHTPDTRPQAVTVRDDAEDPFTPGLPDPMHVTLVRADIYRPWQRNLNRFGGVVVSSFHEGEYVRVHHYPTTR